MQKTDCLTSAYWDIGHSPVTAFLLLDRIIIRTHISDTHETIIIEFPMLITMSTHPLIRVICIPTLVLKSYRNTIFSITPDFLHKAIIQFFCPFPFKEFYYCLSSCEEFCPITPPRIRCVSLRNNFWVACIPSVLSRFDLGVSRFFVKRWSSHYYCSIDY